jgi:hypothetical protein
MYTVDHLVGSRFHVTHFITFDGVKAFLEVLWQTK